MPSFEMIYDTEEDVLEVTFEVFEETFARTIALNERILLFTDTSFQSSWGLNFDGYGTLLQVNETVLDGLNALSEPNRLRILQLLAEPPVSYFLEVRDKGEGIAVIKSPTLEALIG